MGRPAGSLISRESIVGSALRIIDEQGMDGLSIRRIGRDLGVDGSSVYYYFSGKQEIVDAAAAQVLAGIGPADATLADWKEQIVDICLQVRRALTQHPNIIHALIARRQWKFGLPAFERMAEAMTGAGMGPAEQLLIWESLDALNLGGLLFTKSGSEAADEVADLATRYPAAFAALHATLPDEEVRLSRALRAFLVGVEILLKQSDSGETATKSAARKSTARKSTARKSTARKSTARKSTATKSAAPKAVATKVVARKSAATKTAATETGVTKTAV